MTIAERIAALKKQRGESLKQAESIVNKAVDESRDMTEAEETAFNELKASVEALDTQIKKLEDAEKLIARSAEVVVPAAITSKEAQETTTEQRAVKTNTEQHYGEAARTKSNLYKGAAFTRYAIAMAQNKGNPWAAEQYARARWKDSPEVLSIIRAAVDPMSSEEAVGAGGGSALIDNRTLFNEFIEMLRPLTIVNRLPGLRNMSFDDAGSLTLPRQSGGVAGGYVGEGNSIKVERLNFGQLTLSPSKLAVIVPVTNEMLRRSNPSVEMMIRDDMLEGTARTMDGVFMSRASAGAAPAGSLNGVSITAAAALDAAATVTQATTALKALIMALRTANVPMRAPVWVMHERTREYLRLLRTTQEVFAFKSEIDAGMLLGFPIVATTNLPTNLDANGAADVVTPGTGTFISLMDASQVIFAEDMAPVVDASEHAVIQADSAPATPPTPLISAWQQDMTFMRVRLGHSWARRHNEAVAWGVSNA